ncbi:diguanylate cyclase domain-containing protein [Aeromonas lusitana]|uniref:diguanylate cyclase n=1 Tax=Aeromonas lusitana TaxID=931529 RepID=A0A2M8H5J2_9GAMM|nr:sensor domain-containing diguanylate cyclase [Aeromonas lusitana]PJC91819.1 GGDEF domain-containing protein [Aeromonas lusitana]
MAGEIIKKRYYILTPLSFLLGALVLISTLLLAITSYLRSIDKTVAGYEQILTSIDATLIQEMVLDNQRQLAVLEASLDRQAIARGESAVNPIWAIAHQFKHDAHFLYFYNARFDEISSYPARALSMDYVPQQRPWYQAMNSDSDELIWFGPYQDFNSDKQSLTLIKRVEGDGKLLGLLMVDLSFDSVQEALSRAMGNDQAAIYLTVRKSGQIIVGHNLGLIPKVQDEDAEPGTLGLNVIRHGRHLKLELADVGWDLNIYLPPAQFHDSLQETLLMVVLPLLALLAFWLCSLLFLVRIFRQEQALVQGSLVGIMQHREEAPSRPRTWFVRGSLGEIDQVRTSVRQGQNALLHDPLTGIMNRRAFDQHRCALEQAQTPYWLVLIDLDRFKRINDNWGHGVGDAVLYRVATILARTLGEGWVYRIGGDEFAAILPWSQSEVEQRLIYLLARVRGLKWREFKESITLSAGGAHYPDAGESLFERADECLYQSKHQGRDCWHLLPVQKSPSEGEVVTVSV